MPATDIDYPSLLRDALRGVLRRVLQRVGEEGMPGEHHLFVQFRTDHPEVVLSSALRGQYPHEMTIVLQHQFWDLLVDDERFSVTLRFGGAPERISVPFPAVVAFADPAAEFGLQIAGEGAAPEAMAPAAAAEPAPEPEPTPAEVVAEPAGGEGGAKVLRSDRFRRD